MTAVHVVVPDGIDDPARPSGGNTYDRHLCRGLTSIGWSVHEHAVAGRWPRPDAASLAALDGVVQRIPDDAVVLLDGLVASTAPEVLVPQARRLCLTVLVHMPLGHRPADGGAGDARWRERTVLSVAAAVVTTSAWARRRLLELYQLPAHRVHVAEPAVDVADLATETATGEALLCVAAVTFDKGHDVLLDALATMTDLPWRCVCVGSLERDPGFVEGLRRHSLDCGLDDRVCFPGPRTGPDLDRTYAAADLMVLASRAETYGIAVIEALARGLPVIATDVGGLSEALGHDRAGTRPGLLVPPGDPEALGAALRTWLGDAELRAQLRRTARERRRSLATWSTTTSLIAGVLAGASR
ncbi:MAG TPA: glycosyltransferase family 4 protein [Solirubrobacterales bacterium]|nr:glycosyltransferase family 4 protein [Solirubrobacterales bacterium]